MKIKQLLSRFTKSEKQSFHNSVEQIINLNVPETSYEYTETESITKNNLELISRSDTQSFAGKLFQTAIDSHSVQEDAPVYTSYSIKNGRVKLHSCPLSQSQQHTAICGIAGSGKSVLLQNMLTQHSRTKNPFVYYSVHKRDVDQLLQGLSKNELTNLLLFDPDSEDSATTNIFGVDTTNAEEIRETSMFVMNAFNLHNNIKSDTAVENLLREFIEKGLTLKDFCEFVTLSEKQTKKYNLSDSTREAYESLDDVEKEQIHRNINAPDSSIIEMFSDTESVDFSEILQNNQRIVFDLSAFTDENSLAVYKELSTHFVWTSRKYQKNTETPYLFTIDNLEKFTHTSTVPIEAMLTEGSKYNLSVMFSSIFFNRLSEDIQTVIQRNVPNIWGIGRQEKNTAQMFEEMSDLDYSDLLDVELFTLVNASDSAEKQKTIPRYPPRHTSTNARQIALLNTQI